MPAFQAPPTSVVVPVEVQLSSHPDAVLRIASNPDADAPAVASGSFYATRGVVTLLVAGEPVLGMMIEAWLPHSPYVHVEGHLDRDGGILPTEPYTFVVNDLRAPISAAEAARLAALGVELVDDSDAETSDEAEDADEEDEGD